MRSTTSLTSRVQVTVYIFKPCEEHEGEERGEGRGMRGDLEGGGQRGEKVVQEIHLTTSDLQKHMYLHGTTNNSH